MRISERWLREWVALPASTRELAERLTMAGLEVDSVETAAPAFSDVVVGEVTLCEPHPDAERLKVCTVEDGSGEPKAVVCGAPNAVTGLKAPFARVGARLPGDMKIKATKLRGVKSWGMLCSAKELGFSEESAGLMPLPADAPVGEDLREWLDLDDAVIEVELTPNRSDCLSMAGVAREVGVLTGHPVTAPDADPVDAVHDVTRPVRLEQPTDCPRYCGRVIRGIDPDAATPVWLAERLRRAGIRPLSLTVDITNYLMLELGQPMHAFDLEALDGGIRVRHARQGESITLLNGESVTLAAGTLVIADDDRPVAIAGVMGGQDTAVSAGTTDLFLEAAFFAPSAIAGRAREYGLHTDSSHRFERGVDPQRCRDAIERATALILAHAGGEPGPVIEAVDPDHLPATRAVSVRPARANALLGTAIEPSAMEETLTRLGMPPRADGDTWWVEAPSWRFDIAREVDLIEEIARIHGYDRLPSTRTALPASIPAQSESSVALGRLRSLLVDRGYHEAITYSFVPADLQARLDPEHPPLALANPLSSDMDVMRSSLWPGLIRAVVHNRNRQMPRVRLFEAGLRFRGALGALEQTPVIAGVLTGPATPKHWDHSDRPVDFFDIKGDVEGLLALTGPAHACRFESAAHPALHPGQSARIVSGERTIGWVGALHPEQARAMDLDGAVYLFELEQSVFHHRSLPAFKPLSRYPSIRRDLAIVVAESVSADAVRDCITAAAGRVLDSVALFDVYRGKGVSDGCKSLAMGLILQDNSRTLTDDEIDAVQQAVVRSLHETLNAELRE
ncbi:phenylalanine--tRNA ligase subunit beta [Spiribacter vilamensis]|uniref:Phenylalanine--tRNA ligase beta subunit n=1 Tax=Spiribacter vilamensis TaxID=531306 RepID=A0A4Q8D048_9GAMM|nr:phenylalanine--tRNA ligase subunit beta [Spiribacter vilamensis]RZU98668.1 phenylalanyl-tRNA synthetase beta subunit [Spiribacter vilamensis]TVO60075.1 phenylalanine--tRNA ligase subunit beta [Spiribacter vilamensis]